VPPFGLRGVESRAGSAHQKHDRGGRDPSPVSVIERATTIYATDRFRFESSLRNAEASWALSASGLRLKTRRLIASTAPGSSPFARATCQIAASCRGVTRPPRRNECPGPGARELAAVGFRATGVGGAAGCAGVAAADGAGADGGTGPGRATGAPAGRLAAGGRVEAGTGGRAGGAGSGGRGPPPPGGRGGIGGPGDRIGFSA
jgi:hypothetical protein